MERILITVNKNLIIRVDEYIERVGCGSTRSAFFREAAEYYLTIKRGLLNIRRKKKLKDELV